MNEFSDVQIEVNPDAHSNLRKSGMLYRTDSLNAGKLKPTG